jgi:hypothetical protein
MIAHAAAAHLAPEHPIGPRGVHEDDGQQKKRADQQKALSGEPALRNARVHQRCPDAHGQDRDQHCDEADAPYPLLANYKWVPIGYHGRASSGQPGR